MAAVDAPWTIALAWLSEKGHKTTATDADQLQAYFAGNPQQLRDRNAAGCLPLHCAVENQRGKHAVTVAKVLLSPYPVALRRQNAAGYLPLHLAAASQTGIHGVGVVDVLLAAYAQAAQKKNNGYLPLHHAAENQRGHHGAAVVTALLTAYPQGALVKRSGALPVDLAQSAPCVKLLQEAADGQWQAPSVLDTAVKLKVAYTELTYDPETVEACTPVAALNLEQLERLLRQRFIVGEHAARSSAAPLENLADAASTLAAENRLPPSAASLLRAAPLLHELLTAALLSHKPPAILSDLQALCNAAEEAMARLRTCHGALMSHVSAHPPPAVVDAALTRRRDAALAAAQEASSAFSAAIRDTDPGAIALVSKPVDELTTLLDRVKKVTGIATFASHADAALVGSGAVVASSAAQAKTQRGAPLDLLELALTHLNGFACRTAKATARLQRLAPLTLMSLSAKNTKATRNTLETMQEAKHELLVATNDGSLNHYLAFGAPWQMASSRVAVQIALTTSPSNGIVGLASIANQLNAETAAWTAAFEERRSKIDTLESTHATLRLARKALLLAKADADSEDEAGDSHAESIVPAKHACRRASLARDAAAHDLFSLALAYYPELLVQQRKRLAPRGLPPIVNQRSREDYDDIEPFERSRDGRHTLLHANFDGVACVLKMVPIVGEHSLAHEAGILKQVEHPNIVKLLAVFVENDCAYLHMAYASQGDLEQFLAREVAAVADDGAATMLALSPRQLQRLARQLCEAVAYLAERSIVHCDIKPANVFVDGNREDDSLHAVLGDFDVSHAATGRTTTLTRAVTCIATHYTPGFAPPEVLHAPAGQPHRVSPAIDAYGLGCVIFDMHMFPRTFPEPVNLLDAVASNDWLFSPSSHAHAAKPAMAGWAASVPRDVVEAATRARPSARASAKELLHTRYMLEASGSFALQDIQRPAYWVHQTHTGSWLEDESEEVRVAVEKMLNSTADPSTHGTGRDSHREAFQRFKVTRVRRLEHPAVWSSYAAQRRHLADMLITEGYVLPSGIRPLATDDTFMYPLEGGSLDKAAGEVFLFHGPTKPDSIANSGFDVRYAFAGAGAGAMFGRGVYFAESASKADQYAVADGQGAVTMVMARVLLGRTARVTTPRRDVAFLPEVAGKSSPDVPVYYDSIMADMRPQGLRFREIIVGEGSRAYPELFIQYERV